MNGDSKSSTFLLDLGLDPSTVDDCGSTPLFKAIVSQYYSLPLVKMLLDAGAHFEMLDPEVLWFTLISYIGNHEIVKLLLEADLVDTSHEDENGWAPLHHAAHRSTERMVTVLLNGGSDALIQTKEGMTPLHIALARGADLLIVNALLGAKSDISMRDAYGWTPLHAAVSQCPREDVFRTLLVVGSDVLAKTNSGYTPLHLAVG